MPKFPIVPQSEQRVLYHGITAAIIEYTPGRVLKTYAGRVDPPNYFINCLKREQLVYKTMEYGRNDLKYSAPSSFRVVDFGHDIVRYQSLVFKDRP